MISWYQSQSVCQMSKSLCFQLLYSFPTVILHDFIQRVIFTQHSFVQYMFFLQLSYISYSMILLNLAKIFHSTVSKTKTSVSVQAVWHKETAKACCAQLFPSVTTLCTSLHILILIHAIQLFPSVTSLYTSLHIQILCINLYMWH